MWASGTFVAWRVEELYGGFALLHSFPLIYFRKTHNWVSSLFVCCSVVLLKHLPELQILECQTLICAYILC